MHRFDGPGRYGDRNKLMSIVVTLMVIGCWFSTMAPARIACAQEEQWLSGQDSPVHDSDLPIPFSGKTIFIENDDVRVGFDSVSGALVEFRTKRTNWNIQQSPELAQSFRVFAPTPDRSYNPVLGARNKLASITKSSDGLSVTLIWNALKSEYRGTLDITLTGTVTLDGSDVDFDMNVKNGGGWTLTSVEWPVIGALYKPEGAASMQRLTSSYGTGITIPVYSHFQDERGYYGTNWPTQIGAGRYNLILAGDQGLYLGTHDTSMLEVTRCALELKPGYGDSFDQLVPSEDRVSDHRVRIVASMEHFPFLPSGQSMDLARIVLSPFQGDWHHGADVYRRWREKWFHAPMTPAWAEGVNSWQQIQINSAEDDLRTPYRDLPRRAAEAAKAGINAIQLVGWNNGGQDRGNPSHDTDPRLGTYDELKDAIAKIEAMGVHVILFNKYTWVDKTNPEYENGLIDHVAHDPNGVPYQHPGYLYQTPEQLADINTRRFAVACTPDPVWLDLSAKEFRKNIDLGASGIVFDEASHHGGADYCFHRENGQLVAKSIWSGDALLAQRFRQIVRDTVGESKFLLAGEMPYDLQTLYWSVGYFRISPGHIPLERYNDPSRELMIAVTGFNDREMINEALRYRYIISYEPFNFKGNLSDFPLTLNYGLKMDAFRRKYQDYLWSAEFVDNQDATVTVAGEDFSSFSTFRRKDGRRAVVVVNPTEKEITGKVALENGRNNFKWASPEEPELHLCDGRIKVPGRSVIVILEQ